MKLSMRSAAVAVSVTSLVATQAFAEFVSDGIWVVRVGGAGAPTSNTTSGQKVFLDQYHIGDKTLAQSIELSSSGLNPFTLPGTNNNDDGHLNLSGDGKFLTLGGYSAGLGATNLVSSSASSTPRSIAAVYADGSFDTTTKLTNAYNGTAIRAVASDGTSFWTAGGTNNGETNPTLSSGGLRLVTGLGATTSTNISVRTVKPTSPASAEADSQRNVRLIDGQLYINTPAQNGYTNRGTYVMSQTTTASGQSAIPVIINHEGSNIDDNGNPDRGSDTNGKWYPKTDALFFDLDPAIPGYDVAYGTGGKEDYHKWSLDLVDDDANPETPSVLQWKRKTIGLIGGLDSGLEINAFSARQVGDTIQLFASLDGGILMVEDTAGHGAAMSSLFANPQTSGYWIAADGGTAFRGIAVVPEPGSLALSAVGLLALRRRRR